MADQTKEQGKSQEMLLVQSKVKEFIRSQDMMCSSELVDKLNSEVCQLLNRAVARASANSRKTARGCDI